MAYDLGMRPLFINHRGHMEMHLTRSVPYGHMTYGDQREVILHAKKRYPGADVYAIGNSMGGRTLAINMQRH